MAAGARADEHEHGLTYSVFQETRGMRAADANQILKTQELGSTFLPGWHATADLISGGFRDMYGPAAKVAGATNLDKAQGIMNGKLSAMGINAAEWHVVRNNNVGHAAFVDFEQRAYGHDVVFARLQFRFTTDGLLQRVKTNNYGSPEQGLAPTITASDALNTAAMTTDLGAYTLTAKNIAPEWVWFPVPTKHGYDLRPAWSFSVSGIGAHEMPIELKGYIDARTGELLYRSNEVNTTFDVQASAQIYVTSPLAPTGDVFMNDMNVSIGGNTYTTDDTGFISVPTANAPLTATYIMQGPWARVRRNNTNGSTPQFGVNMANSGTVFKLPATDSTTQDFRAVSAFYFANKVHNFMKGYWPNFTGMDMPITTVIDRAGNTCNAFYNNGGYNMNFYAPQTTCRSFAVVGDVVFHEYGHGISYRFYSSQSASFQNGAMGEGNSDVWAMSINKDGTIGEGGRYAGNGSIRDYTGTPKVYPQDIQNQVHNDGEIIAGSWWDVAQNIGSVDTMTQLFTLTHYDVPNGPSGTEGEIYHDVLISALMNDDDDNNLGNGTPHFKAIVDAFARHGIYLLGDASIKHKEVPHQPVNTPTTISAELVLTNPAFFDELYMVYRNRYGSNSNWDTVTMTNTSGNIYQAQIPAMAGGSIVDYFFLANDVIKASAFGLPRGYSPDFTMATEVTLPYQYGVGMNFVRYKEDFEGTLSGWQLGVSDDNATGGIWVDAVPVGTSASGLQIQPGADNTTGSGKCLVTGNGSALASSADVDNGKTTAVSPTIQIPFYEPVVEYYRWFSNDRGSNSNLRNDYWTVEIRSSTSPLWRRVDYTRESDQQWRRRIFRVSEFIGTPAAIEMRFIAEDRIISSASQDGQNIIEAAVDDFIIYEGAPLSVEDAKAPVNAKVYPNPADGVVNISLPQAGTGTATLMDVTGKTITQIQVAEGQTEYQINTSGLAAGTYVVLLQTNYVVQSTRITVEHK